MKQKCVFISCVLIILSLMVFTQSTYTADENKSKTAYDHYTGKSYSVAYRDCCLNIEDGENSFSIPYENPEFTPMVYDGVFVFLSLNNADTSEGFLTDVTVFDSATKALWSFASNINISEQSPLFACDDSSTVYLCSKDDRRNILRISPYCDPISISCPSNVDQIMCFGGDFVLLFTSDGIFSLSGDVTQKIFDDPLCVPCNALSENEFITADSRVFYVADKALEEVLEETTSPTLEQITDESVIEEYSVTFEDNFIYAKHGITVSKLRKALGLRSDEIAFIRNDGNVKTSGKLGTGMKALYEGGERIIVIKGELTGEGNINSRDLKLMMRFVLGEIVPSDIEFIAADLNNDGMIAVDDLALLSNMY